MTSQLRLAVHSFPGERPVLLVHGFTSSAQIDWIEPGWPQALAAQGRGTVAVDLPGHGSCPAADRDAISVSTIVAGWSRRSTAPAKTRPTWSVIRSVPGWPGPWLPPAG